MPPISLLPPRNASWEELQECVLAEDIRDEVLDGRARLVSRAVLGEWARTGTFVSKDVRALRLTVWVLMRDRRWTSTPEEERRLLGVIHEVIDRIWDIVEDRPV